MVKRHDLLIHQGRGRKARKAWADSAAVDGSGNVTLFRGKPMVKPWETHLSPRRNNETHASQAFIEILKFANKLHIVACLYCWDWDDYP